MTEVLGKLRTERWCRQQMVVRAGGKVDSGKREGWQVVGPVTELIGRKAEGQTHSLGLLWGPRRGAL